MSKRIVVAIGGNSLIKDKDHKTVPDQYAATEETVPHIVDLVEDGWSVAITHGNGPQVGFILRRSELAAHELHEVPLDFCGADTQGAIGYMLQQTLHNEFQRRKMKYQSVTVVTQVLVDQNDPAFIHPNKPIGSFMDKDKADQRIEEGWHVVEDAGRGWRRVVPSPMPHQVMEARAVENLLEDGFVVITVGGGGIPVIEEDGRLKGVAAVIDKDRASALLCKAIDAKQFLISTSVDQVYLNFGKPNQKAIDKMTVSEAQQYLKDGHFAPGSMAPKIESIIKFIEEGGELAIITSPENMARAIKGEAGTRITPD
ncbi:MAG: carbamate kinase [Candidatus Thorarchaeota archaeon]